MDERAKSEKPLRRLLNTHAFYAVYEFVIFNERDNVCVT
jgi:hypothetical protein